MASAFNSTGTLDWTPYGGNNIHRIGANCGVYTYTAPDGKQRSIVVDVGMLFGDLENDGANVLLPDIRDQLGKADAIYLTHAHLDHTGALVHYVRWAMKDSKFKLPPILGSARTLEMVKKQLQMEGIYSTEKGTTIPTKGYPDFWVLEPNVAKPATNNSPFMVTSVPASHSHPESILVIDTPAGAVFHSGDLNCDPDILSATPTDLNHLKQLSDDFKAQGKPVLSFMLDSTNALSDSERVSEKLVREEIAHDLAPHTGRRVIVSVMGANMERIYGLAWAAAENNRVLVTTGKALENTLSADRQACLRELSLFGTSEGLTVDQYISRIVALDPVYAEMPKELAEDSVRDKYVKTSTHPYTGKTRTKYEFPVNLIISARINRYVDVQIAGKPAKDGTVSMAEKLALEPAGSNRAMILTTGTQGGKFEEMAGTQKMARGEHKFITLNADDVFMISARAIPGNEGPFAEMCAQLLTALSDGTTNPPRVGTLMLHDAAKGDFYHTSGHGHVPDLVRMALAVAPDYLFPVHGGAHQLAANAQLKDKMQVIDSINVGNGAVVRLSDAGGPKVIAQRPRNWIGVIVTETKDARGRFVKEYKDKFDLPENLNPNRKPSQNGPAPAGN